MLRNGWRRLVVGVGLAAAACGGGGGGHSTGSLSQGAIDWAVPFAPASGGRVLTVALHNLDTGAAIASLQRYRADGTPDTLPTLVTLDGWDQQVLTVSGTSGGWVHVTTPSGSVEVGFRQLDGGKLALESSRAWPLGDLAAPPPSTTATVTSTPWTTSVQLGNATGVATLVTGTAYQTLANPVLSPTVIPLTPILLAPFETRLISPDTVTGVSGFVGTLRFDAATPIFCAVEEDLAFDGVPPLARADRTLDAVVYHGLDVSGITSTDFAVVARNDSDVARTLVVSDITGTGGASFIPVPRQVTFAPHESLILRSTDDVFADVFGDATTKTVLSIARIELFVPGEIQATIRQFDGTLVGDAMTTTPAATGHVVDVLDVAPTAALPSATRTYVNLINPSSVSISVAIAAVVPQPTGFPAFAQPITTITVPAFGFVTFSPDGATFVDRDLLPVPNIVIRATSPAPFAVTGRKEVRSLLTGILVELSPIVARSFDDAR